VCSRWGGKKAKAEKENVDDLKRQVAQLNREYEAIQSAIPAAKAAENVIQYITSKKDPLLTENHQPDWDPPTGGCCSS